MEQQKIWSYYQREAKYIFNKSAFRLKYLTRFLTPGNIVLNVGIGGGVFENYAKLKRVNIFTLDPDWESLKPYVKDNKLKLISGRIENLPFPDEFFNEIVVSEVIEHLTPISTHLSLSEMHRVLSHGGKIIGTVPCEEDLSDNMVVCPECGKVFHKFGHLQSFSKKSLVSLLSGYFSKTKCFIRPFMAKEKIGLKEYLVDLVRKPLIQTGILTREKHLVFLAIKKN